MLLDRGKNSRETGTKKIISYFMTRNVMNGLRSYF